MKAMTDTTRQTITTALAQLPPIGTRLADGPDDHYTVAGILVDALSCDPQAVLIHDIDIEDSADPRTAQPEYLSNLGTLEPLPADPAKAGRAAEVMKAIRKTDPYRRYTSLADLTPDTYWAFAQWIALDEELTRRQAALADASQARGQLTALVAQLLGSQSAASQVLGINQSNISRAIENTEQTQGAETTCYLD